MRIRQGQKDSGRPGRDGFTMLEVMIAAMLVIVVFFGLAQVYSRGRAQLELEKNRRQANGIAQACIDGLRTEQQFDDLDDLDGDVVSYEVGGRTYDVELQVDMEEPETHAATVAVVVRWDEDINGGIERSISCTTILARGLN